MGNCFKATALLSQLGMILAATPANAAGYICERAAVPAQFTAVSRPRGNWGPLHNTSKWDYVAVPGDNDVYQRRGTSNTIQTLCKRDLPTWWDLGDRKNDHNGAEDSCGNWSVAVSGSQTGVSCPSGFSVTGNGANCFAAGAPRKFTPNRPPRGDWGITDDTRNYVYVAVQAPALDFYRNTKRPRSNVIGTRCDRPGVGGWNFGTLEKDYNGLQDMCGNWTEATQDTTVAAQCPAGHALVYKP